MVQCLTEALLRAGALLSVKGKSITGVCPMLPVPDTMLPHGGGVGGSVNCEISGELSFNYTEAAAQGSAMAALLRGDQKVARNRIAGPSVFFAAHRAATSSVFRGGRDRIRRNVSARRAAGCCSRSGKASPCGRFDVPRRDSSPLRANGAPAFQDPFWR